MHNQVDLYVKEVLREGFEGLGATAQEVEVSAAAQRIDFSFVPSVEASAEAWAQMPPLLARLGRKPFIVEHYHGVPRVDAMRGCLRKQLTHHHRRCKKDKRAKMAVLWVLSNGRPRSVMRGFAFKRLRGWPKGVYRGPLSAVPYRVIVLTELPEVRETLPLRLLGRGKTLTQALTELWALPLDSWERTHMLRALLEYRLPTTEEEMAALKEDGQEKEIERMAQGFVKQLEERERRLGLEQGRQLGLEQERAKAAQGLVHMFERRLSRPLAEAEKATIRERYDSVGPVRLGDVVLDLKPAELSAWLADPDAK